MVSIIKSPRLFLYALLLSVAQGGWAYQSQPAFIRIENSPDDAVCIATKSTISNVQKDQAGSLYGVLRNRQIKVPFSLVVGELSFHAFETNSFTVVQGKVSRQRISSYYTLDISNSGVVRTVELVAGGYKGASEGGGDILWVYGSSWVNAPKPIDANVLADIVLEIGYRTFTFYKDGADFSFKYYIYPFQFKTKNFLLIESNVGSPRKYAVAEVAEDFKVATRCSF